MLAVSKLNIEFGGRTLFDNVSYNVNPKERIGLIGKNGAGKSTMLKIIAGVSVPTNGDISHPKGYKLGYLPQEGGANSVRSVISEAETAFQEIKLLNKKLDDISNQLAQRTDYESDSYLKLLEDINKVTDRLKILGADNIQGSIETTLEGLGFKRDEFLRPVNTFSGGWQMRIELAKILLVRPDLILLDEPTNHLDIESILWLEEFLSSYEGAVMIVSHDRRFLDTVTNRTIEIVAGKTYDLNFKYSDFMEKREEIIKVQLAAKKNQDKQIKQMEEFASKYRAKARQASRVQSKLKAIEKIDRIEIDDIESDKIHFRFPDPPRSSRTVAETQSLIKRYGDKIVLNEIDFFVEREEKVAFIGRNGEGKSTLSKIFAGIITDYEGKAHVGQSVHLGYYAQHQAELMEGSQSVFDIIDSAAKGDIRTQIRNLLGAFLFTGDDIYKKVSVLSGGEKSRLALCKLLLEPYNFLILDEPTNHLDMKSKDILKDALLNFQGACIIVSHDRDFLQDLTSRTIEFKDRKIKEYHGNIEYYLEKRKINNIQEIELKEIIEKEMTDSTFEKKKPNFSKDKEYNRAKQKLSKQNDKLESTIEKLENTIGELESKFSLDEYHSDPLKSQELSNDIQLNKNQLQETLVKWENVQNDLLELEEKYSKD